MRLLSVRQPWAFALAHGLKPVENRTRRICGDYRGPVAIQASTAGVDPVGVRALFDLTPLRSVPISHGVILAVADLVDAHHADDCERPGGWCTDWSDPESWHLVFEDARPLKVPVPFKGAQGMRKLTPAEEQLIRGGGDDV